MKTNKANLIKAGIGMVIIIAGSAYILHQAPNVVYPNPNLTPGAINTSITQANMDQTICNPNWSTSLERPPVSYTNPLKIAQIKEYGYKDTNLSDYEEDHLISLEIGGSPTDPKNLWPEIYPQARWKDKVENFLHKEVCAGQITLAQAQTSIVKDWYSIYVSITNPSAISSVDPNDN